MDIEKVGVIGCGLMGHGIAQVAAAAGYSVVVFETDAGALEHGMDRIGASLEKLAEKAVKKGKQTEAAAAESVQRTKERISGTHELSDLADCDLVIEAIVEDLNAKNLLFVDLDGICESKTIFASNTSSFPIELMAEASRRPDRFVGLHFFNPVQLMPLAEVVRTDAASDEVIQASTAFVTRCGKTPVACGDTPGFVVNRLLVPLMVQALLMVDRGDATPADVDTAMQLGCGHPMGPITLADYVGLDTTLSILEGWCERYPDEPAFVIPGSLRTHVAAGRFGRKSGQGYYAWDGDRRVD